MGQSVRAVSWHKGEKGSHLWGGGGGGWWDGETQRSDLMPKVYRRVDIFRRWERAEMRLSHSVLLEEREIGNLGHPH